MPTIIPVTDLKDTAAVSRLCHETRGPIFITKNGYGDMVLMSMEAYDEKAKAFVDHVVAQIDASEADEAAGRVDDADQAMRRVRAAHAL